MKIFIFVSLITVLPELTLSAQFKCTRVYDGDTIKATGGRYEITVRPVGIDAPETSKKENEPGQPFSQKSTKYLASLVLNKMIEIEEYSNDLYRRILGVVYLNGMNVNLEMVKAGLAEVYRGAPASGLDMVPYWNAEKEAKNAGRGMWSLGDKYISPREWRKQKSE